MQKNLRVLNIASHVVHGHVGNCATTFPLQLNGFTVNSINSVQFSNHTGYKNFPKGQKLTGEDLQDLIDGLESNDLLDNFSHMLTGYIGSATFLNAVSDVVTRIKQKNPNMKYVCDPVMGDTGKLYVPSDMIDLYRTLIVPKAYMITPNQFEAEKLIQNEILNEKDCINAIEILHSLGPQIVVITSTFFSEDPDAIVLYGSQKQEHKQQLFKIAIKKILNKDQIPYFTGTGDLLAAMLLAHEEKNENDFGKTIEIAVNIVNSVLIKSREFPMIGKDEISLVASKNEIEFPQIRIKGEYIVNNL